MQKTQIINIGFGGINMNKYSLFLISKRKSNTFLFINKTKSKVLNVANNLNLKKC